MFPSQPIKLSPPTILPGWYRDRVAGERKMITALPLILITSCRAVLPRCRIVVGAAVLSLSLLSAYGYGDDGLVVSKPLAPRSGPRGKTMFQLMPPEQTGIVTENNYSDPAMWGLHTREFLYGGIGTGVAIADYDGDGRPDIFVVSKTGTCRLFRNLGDWKFEDVTEKAGVGDKGEAAGIWKQGVTFVDVNNDGLPDIYICRFNAPNLLYINQGDGTFKEEAAARGLAIKDGAVMAAFCDYDGDGWLDVFIVTNVLDYKQSSGRPDRLFHNNGNGTFTEVTAAAGISSSPDQGHAAIWWDYDNDGRPDLYVANDFGPPDFLYHNNGDGTFTDQISAQLPHTPNSSMGADLGDLNNDGRIDLLVADMEPTNHEKDQRTLAAARALRFTPPDDPLVALQVPRNALYLNTGTSRSLEAAELTGLGSSDWTWSVRCEDLDCDGRLDVIFLNGMVRELHNLDLHNRVYLTDGAEEYSRMIKASPPLLEHNLAFRNLGDLKFENVSAAWGLDAMGVSFGAALGDLDGDGDLDLIYSNYQSGVTVLRNDADTGHRVVMHLRGTASNRFGVGATVRIETTAGVQVRQLVLARGYLSSSEPIIHFGLGELDHIDRTTITWPSGRVQTLTNLAADRNYTITEPLAPPPPLITEKPRLQFTEIAEFAGLAHLVEEAPFDEDATQPLLPRYFNHCGPAIAVGDLDGDGTDDVCFGGTTRDPPQILLADRQGYYHETNNLAAFGNTMVNDGPILIFDANGDGTNDILLTSGGVAAPAESSAYQPRLLLNQGQAKFVPAAADALPPLPICVGAAAAADFDRDGKIDVFLGGRIVPGQYPLPPRSALLRNTGGKFEDVTDTIAPGLRTVGLVTSALWTDVDGDGWLDLLVAVEWGPVRYFHNQHGEKFEDWTEKAGFAAAGNGWWTSIAAADFNGDGQLDYVVGNLGLNTPYRASTERPVSLYRGIFADGIAPLTVEGYYEGDQLFTRSTRSELGAVLPVVRKHFPKNDDYAKATLAEIVGADRLAAATHFTATQLRSGVFLSQPDGTYHFEPLPRIAQIAPLQGIVTGDFDGDGHADILAVQNNYSFAQTIGRFDGGLGQFLRGDGHGHFTPVPPADCGLVVPGDSRALALIDFDGDGWPDFLLTRSKSPSLAWQNRGISGHHTLQVQLQGRPGNRTAIGARVTVALADGTTQTSEVAAGSGVLSQGTTTLFFGYPSSNPPRAIHVRWPDGTKYQQNLTANPGRLNLAEPMP